MGAGEGGHTPLENLGDVTFPGKLEPPPPWKNEERKKTLEWDILNPNRLILIFAIQKFTAQAPSSSLILSFKIIPCSL